MSMNVYGVHFDAAFRPLARSPAYWLPAILFPTLFFSFFGLPAARQGAEVANLLMASFSAFAVIGIAFFQFGVGIAQTRESKWEEYARTLPAGAAPRLAAQMATAAIFVVFAVGLLWTLAAFAAPIELGPARYGRLAIALVIGIIPFVLMGAALGYAVPARAAVPLANLLFLPLSYLGGLWMPPQMLPGIVAEISPYTPTRQFGELVWAAVQDRPAPQEALIGLGLYAAGAGLLALILWRRDESVKVK